MATGPGVLARVAETPGLGVVGYLITNRRNRSPPGREGPGL